ncbi:MAG: MBL fold metallo-hydrolase [Parachlamydiales bacterium]|nr:MBL fold metallo-hydrolase [Parachlamydiales bacterium]
MTALFLGTGASTGVPSLACNCSVCKSKSKYNKRLRPSLLVNYKKKNILIDAGPDIRQQLLKCKAEKIDYLILTHAHYDHMAGLDDLREYSRRQKQPIKCFLSNETFIEIKKRFSHLFTPNVKGHTQAARFDFVILDKNQGSFRIDHSKALFFSYYQDSKKVLGIRISNFAYLTDIKTYKENIFNYLKDLDVLILSCLRPKLSNVHFNIQEALDFSKKVCAKKTFLTHLGHEIDYLKAKSTLTKNVFLAYDGLKFKFS